MPDLLLDVEKWSREQKARYLLLLDKIARHPNQVEVGVRPGLRLDLVIQDITPEQAAAALEAVEKCR